jgi:DNA-directed RNA polymerase subunit RPC12/RpoP
MSKQANKSEHHDLRVEVVCPYCEVTSLISLPITREADVKWDEDQNRFLVSFSFLADCGYGHRWNQIAVVKEVPLVITDASRCSCGSTLTLRNYALRKTEDLVEFEAEYICSACQKSNKTMLRTIGKALGSIWRKTRKIEIGPKGLSYEKESD